MTGTATTIASVIALLIVGSLLLVSGVFIKPMTGPWNAFAGTVMIWAGWTFIISSPAYVIAIAAIRFSTWKERDQEDKAASTEQTS